MQADYFDRYSRLVSPVHRQSSTEKLVIALAMVIIAVALPRTLILWLIPLGVLLLGIAWLSRIPWSYLVRRLLLLEPLVLGLAILSLFQPGGWQSFFVLVFRTSVCLLTMILLASTTPFSDLLHILRRLHIPGLFITTLALMYRYLFVLVDESLRMKRARLSRTFCQRPHRTWHAISNVIGQLFVRATERAERIYGAMCARGWQ